MVGLYELLLLVAVATLLFGSVKVTGLFRKD